MPSVEFTLSQHRRAWSAPPILADEDGDDGLWQTLSDGRRILRANAVRSVPMMLMDSADEAAVQRGVLEQRFQQGLLTDGEARAYADEAREAEMARLADAWRGPGDRTSHLSASTGDPRADAQAAHDAQTQRLADAWKGPQALGDAYPPYRDPTALPGSWANPPPPWRWPGPHQSPPTIKPEPWVGAMQERQQQLRQVAASLGSTEADQRAYAEATGGDARAEADAAFEAESKRRSEAWRGAVW